MNQAGHEAIHWSSVGDFRAPDTEILRFAREHDQIVFTHDLDFAALLVSTRQAGPSVLQIRAHDVLPDAMGAMVLAVLDEQATALAAGALISVDEASARVRILPIK